MGRLPPELAESRRSEPIWDVMREQGRSVRWLAGKIGYSYSHVLDVRGGFQPGSAAFRRACALALGLPEAVLFRADYRAGRERTARDG